MTWIVAAAVGLVAGALGGLLGVGGGVVMVPAFTRLLGMSVKQAIGTSMAVILFTAASAAWRHHQLGNVKPQVVLVVAALSVVGAWLGASLTSRVPERALRVVFALFLLATAADMLGRAWQGPIPAEDPPADTRPAAGRSDRSDTGR